MRQTAARSSGCDARHWRRRRRVAALTLWVALASSLGAVRGISDDRDIARILLQQGKAALEKGDASDAFAKLTKARAEDPKLLEVAYWMAAALEKLNDPRSAIGEYRAFIGAVGALASAGPPPKELGSLQKKAVVRLNALDACRREVEKANDGFAERVVAFARARPKAEVDVALRALGILEGVRPGFPAATELIAALSGSGANDEFVDGLDDRWDFIASRHFGKSTGWTYEAGFLEVNAPTGLMNRASSGFMTGDSFSYELDATRHGPVTAGRVSVLGLMFAVTAAEAYGLMSVNAGLQVERVVSGRNTTLTRVPIPEWTDGARRTIGIRVDGPNVKVYVDRKMVHEWKSPDRTSFAGELAFVVENVRGRVHGWRAARTGKGGK